MPRKIFDAPIPGNRIYVPAGSELFFENLMRMQIDGHFGHVNIIGVKPQAQDSRAKMLVSKYLPFRQFDERTLKHWKEKGLTGSESRVIEVPEEHIKQSYGEMRAAGVKTGYSGAAGLAGKRYMNKEGLVINTGIGVEERLVDH